MSMPRRGFAIDVNRNEDVTIIGITFFEAFAQIFGVNPRIRRTGRGGQGHFADGIREIVLFGEPMAAIGCEQCCCWRCRCCYRCWRACSCCDRVVGCLQSQQAIVENHRGNWIERERKKIYSTRRSPSQEFLLFLFDEDRWRKWSSHVKSDRTILNNLMNWRSKTKIECQQSSRLLAGETADGRASLFEIEARAMSICLLKKISRGERREKGEENETKNRTSSVFFRLGNLMEKH